MENQSQPKNQHQPKKQDLPKNQDLPKKQDQMENQSQPKKQDQMENQSQPKKQSHLRKSLTLALDNMRMNADNFLIIALLYLGLPLGLSIFMIFSVTGAVTSETDPKLSVTFIDNDRSTISESYIQTLEATGLFLPVTDGDYIITFPEGFGRALLAGDTLVGGDAARASDTLVGGDTLVASDAARASDAAPELGLDDYYPTLENINGGSSGEQLIENVMEEVGKTFYRSAAIQANMAEAGLSAAEQSALLNRIATSEQAFSITTETINQDTQDLQSSMNESFAFGYLSYIIVMFAMAIPTSMRDMQKKGTAARVASTPTSKSDLITSDFFATWWLALVILFLYLMFHRQLTGAFQGNLGIYILILAVFSAVSISAIVLLNTLIPNTTATTAIVSILMIIQVMGASIGPMIATDEGSPVALLLEKVRIDQSMQQMFTNNRVGGFGQSDLLQLSILAALAILFIVLSILRENARKEARI